MKGQELVLSKIAKVYGSVRALDHVDLTVAPGSLTTLLGPSGCGKTSLLRIVAGLTTLSNGQVCLGGRDITGMPANLRNIGVVFQNYALFPHMTVAENVAFGLRARGVPRGEVAGKVNASLELVRLDKFASRYPGQLSGGQQQRTALARALVIEPDLLLLDEPLSALDKNLRHSVQQELRKLQKEVGITTMVVTHDQDEAFVLSDEIVVMNTGRVLQRGNASEIYDRPRTRFVAEFLGDGNFIDPKVESITADGSLPEKISSVRLGERSKSSSGSQTLFFRPECVELRPSEEGSQHGVNMPSRVTDVISVGGTYEVLLETERGSSLNVHVPRREGFSFGIGQQVVAFVRAEDLTWLDEE